MKDSCYDDRISSPFGAWTLDLLWILELGSWNFEGGLLRVWPHDGTYEAFLQSDLLLEVRAVLKRYERWSL